MPKRLSLSEESRRLDACERAVEALASCGSVTGMPFRDIFRKIFEETGTDKDQTWQRRFLDEAERAGFVKRGSAQDLRSPFRPQSRAIAHWYPGPRPLEEAYDRDVIAQLLWPGRMGAVGLPLDFPIGPGASNAGVTEETSGGSETATTAAGDVPAEETRSRVENSHVPARGPEETGATPDEPLLQLVAAMESYRDELLRLRGVVERLPEQIAEGLATVLAEHLRGRP